MDPSRAERSREASGAAPRWLLGDNGSTGIGGGGGGGGPDTQNTQKKQTLVSLERELRLGGVTAERRWRWRVHGVRRAGAGGTLGAFAHLWLLLFFFKCLLSDLRK